MLTTWYRCGINYALFVFIRLFETWSQFIFFHVFLFHSLTIDRSIMLPPLEELTRWELYLLGGVLLTLVCLLGLPIHRSILPRPLPDIPYSTEASKRIWGHLSDFLANPNDRGWILKEGIKLRSPVFQLFVGPFSKPIVIVMNPASLRDVAFRSTKEFDRSRMHMRATGPIAPEQQLSLHATDPRFKRNRELIRDLMGPTFLHKVSSIFFLSYIKYCILQYYTHIV